MPLLARDMLPARLGRWLPATSDLSFPPQGMTSQVAFVEPAGAVLKRCADPLYLDWLRREREVLAALESTDLPVPRLLDSLDAGSEVWLVMTRLPGSSFSAALHRTDRAGRLPLLAAAGDFLRRLHATPAPPRLARPGRWIDGQLAQARENLPWCDGSLELLERLGASLPAPVGSTLIHGDLSLENLLVGGGEVTGLVDWAGGDIGDPRCDVALALQPDEVLSFDNGELDAFFCAYGERVDPDVRRWFEDLYEFF